MTTAAATKKKKKLKRHKFFCVEICTRCLNESVWNAAAKFSYSTNLAQSLQKLLEIFFIRLTFMDIFGCFLFFFFFF